MSGVGRIGRRALRRHHRPRRGRAFGGLIALAFVVGVLPPAVDAAKGFATPGEGCRVWQVTDGDTVKIFCPQDGQGGSARLLGFDTPELFSPQCLSERWAAMKAFAYLRWALWSAGEVSTRREGTDRYGRALIRLSVDGEDIAPRMIGSGLARPYSGGRRLGWCS